MGDSVYKQSIDVLFNPEKVSIPIVNCDYSLNIKNVDLLCEDAVGFPHRHNSDIEICYLAEGTLKLDIDGKIIELSEHDYLCIAPGVPHHTLYAPKLKNRYFVMIFNFMRSGEGRGSEKPARRNITDRITALLQELGEKKYCTGPDQQELGQYIEAMTRELQNGALGWKSALHTYYTLFVLNMLRNLATSGCEQYEVSENAAARINKYLSEHYNENITLQDLADILFYSPRHINRIFDQYFNSSFAKVLSQYRVNYAKNYLIESDYSIEKIAALVGYSSSNTLFKLFKEIEGVTPGQYREIHRPGTVPQEKGDEPGGQSS